MIGQFGIRSCLALLMLFCAPVFAAGPTCDADHDGDIDLLDINAIIAARGEVATGPGDPRDFDGNGKITASDAARCRKLCTAPGCPVIDSSANRAPVADAGADQTVFAGTTVLLDGSGSSDPDGDALTYSWTLKNKPPGSSAVLSTPAAVTTTFVADRAGRYVARLVVGDGNVQSEPDSVRSVAQPTGSVAELSAALDSIDFGVLTFGSDATTTVTLTNLGPGIAAGLSVGALADDRFSVASSCGDLIPGRSCSLDVTFSANVDGIAESALTVTSADGASVAIALRGVSVGGALWVTPLALDFGPVGVGTTSPPQVVTITNQGSTTLAAFAGGAPFDTQFGASQNCAGGVAPGASCHYTFDFAPTAVGAASTTSNSSTNAGPFVIELRGTGVGAGLSVSPLTLDFGPVGVGTTSPVQIVTITNTGKAELTAFAGGAPFDTQFGASQSCAGGVAPGASCQYNFSFTPSAVGAVTTTSNSSTNAGPFTIELSGEGVGAGLSVSPLVLDFGLVPIGTTSATQIVTITNTGKAGLTAFAGGAPFDTQFGASQSCAGGVAPGANCQYNFSFTPTAVGAVTTTSNSSTNAGPFVIELRGEAVLAGDLPVTGPGLWVSPLVLDFGPVGVGTTSPVQKVTITNTGDAILTSFAGGAPFDTQFGASQSCAGGVAPGASCQYSFSFTPSAVGAASTTSNSSTNAGPFVIELRGEGVGPGLSVSPLVLDFGPVGVGSTSAVKVVTITNTGKAGLSAFAGGAPFDTQFGASQNCAGGVAPGASCQYNFSFTPSAVGAVTTTSNSSTNAGPFTIELRGEGIGPELWVTPTWLHFGTVAVGAAGAAQTVTISNTGAATLTDFAGGAPFDTQFGASQNCAGGVAPGASCQYFFTFNPGAAGYSTTSSNSSTNAGPFTIDLEGGSQ